MTVGSFEGRTPLVGRVRELAALTAALDGAKAGRGSVHMVTGEGGVGKSRLTVAVHELASSRGFAVVTGRAFPVETGIPYALFADAFVPLLRDMPTATLQTLTRGGASEIAMLFPALRTDAAPPRVGDAAELKPRLLDSFGQLVQRLARKEPMLVVLENLQWADPSSFDLLHFVSRTAGAHPLVLLCTYNEAQRETNPMLRATEQSLISLGRLERHLLPPLTVEETTELVTLQFNVAAPVVEDFVRLLHDRTRGNPFFIEETLKALVQSERLHRDGERWLGWETEHLALPTSIRDALRARYDRLSPTAQDVVILAAVVGATVPHALIEAMAEVDQPVLLAAVDELLRERVFVESSGDGVLAYEFMHPLMQEMLYAEIARARVRALHAQIADSLEGLYGEAATDHADELAVHFLRAESPAQSDRACRYATAAGRSALDRGANREAVVTLSAALAIAERNDDVHVRESLHNLLARARNRLGDYAGASALWAEAVAFAKAVGDHRRVASLERRLGVADLRRGDVADALRHHELGLDAAIAAGDDELVASVRLARVSALLEVGRGDDAARELRDALAIAERVGDPQLLARVHQSLQSLANYRGPSEEARLQGERALTYATQAMDEPGQWRAHWALAMQAGLTGDALRTARHLADARRIAHELRSPLLRLWTAEVEIEYHSGVGEWETAIALADRTIADARAFGQVALLPRLLVWSALVHLGRGDYDRGRAQVEEAWTLSGADHVDSGSSLSVLTVVPAHVGRASWHLSQGEYHKALQVGEAGLAIIDRTGYTAWSLHRLMPAVAEASLWVQDWARAEHYGARLRDSGVRLGHPLAIAWSDACFALERMLQGDKAGATEQLRRAADALDAIPFVEHGARLRRKLADAYNDSGDPQSAIVELRRVHDTFARLGAKPALDEARSKLRELGARPPSRTVAAAPATGLLTAREMEIARLVAARKSNKEIGTALEISSRTVSTHLSNIFAKLGVESRGELSDRVRSEMG